VLSSWEAEEFALDPHDHNIMAALARATHKPIKNRAFARFTALLATFVIKDFLS
jgi:hypothetical protein